MEYRCYYRPNHLERKHELISFEGPSIHGALTYFESLADSMAGEIEMVVFDRGTVSMSTIRPGIWQRDSSVNLYRVVDEHADGSRKVAYLNYYRSIDEATADAVNGLDYDGVVSRCVIEVLSIDGNFHSLTFVVPTVKSATAYDMKGNFLYDIEYK